jgi:GTPase SAR1 family protein
MLFLGFSPSPVVADASIHVPHHHPTPITEHPVSQHPPSSHHVFPSTVEQLPSQPSHSVSSIHSAAIETEMVQRETGREERRERDFKILMVGSGVVGKTSVASVFATGQFPPFDQWIPSEVYQRTLTLSGHPPYHLYILDMASDENRPEFADIFQEYMNTCDCIVLVYTVCSRQTLNEASFFYNQIISFREKRPPTVLLLGNMTDDSVNREVTFEEGAELAASLHCQFAEASAFTGDGIDAAFRSVVISHLDQLVVLERQEEIERIMRLQEEEERRLEEEEREKIRMREEELMNQMRMSVEEREKEQNALLEEEMRQREAMKKAALENMRFLY